jgi:hypothetical protein
MITAANCCGFAKGKPGRSNAKTIPDLKNQYFLPEFTWLFRLLYWLSKEINSLSTSIHNKFTPDRTFWPVIQAGQGITLWKNLKSENLFRKWENVLFCVIISHFDVTRCK